jgi:hypothetical protein
VDRELGVRASGVAGPWNEVSCRPEPGLDPPIGAVEHRERPLTGSRVAWSTTRTLSLGAALAACEAASSTAAAGVMTPALVRIGGRLICPTCARIVIS